MTTYVSRDGYIKPSSEGFLVVLIMDIIINKNFRPNQLIYNSWFGIIIFSLIFSLYYFVNGKLIFLIITIVTTFPIVLLTTKIKSSSL